MRPLVVFLFFALAILAVAGPPQEAHPPFSKDELLALLQSTVPAQVIIDNLDECGISFRPTPDVLEELRKAGATPAVLTAVKNAWHEEIPKPLGDREILVMLDAAVPSERILRTAQQRGIDFRPSAEYLAGLHSHGATAPLIDYLRSATPQPFSKDELLQSLRRRVDQEGIEQQVKQRAIDFDPNSQNLEALRKAGAQAALVEVVRTATRAKVAMNPNPAAQAPPTQPLPPAVVEGKPASLTCGEGDKNVPVFATAGDLGKISTYLPCGQRVTFVEKSISPPGFDKIRYGEASEGFVPDGFLQANIATPGGDVTAPTFVYHPGPKYTPQALRHKLEGVVKFSIVIDPQGNVADIQQISPPLGDGLDQNAMDTVRKWKFNPSTREGVPVAVRVQTEVTFHMLSKPR